MSNILAKIRKNYHTYNKPNIPSSYHVNSEALKGVFGGNCNRTICQQSGATWYNHSTRKYYCPNCAEMLNEDNRKDAMEIFGHELCTKQTEPI